jgi:hypothetical protein
MVEVFLFCLCHEAVEILFLPQKTAGVNRRMNAEK